MGWESARAHHHVRPRQVGKTELLVHFIADKPAIYFYAGRQLAGDHLRDFTEQVLTLEDDPVLRVQP